LGKAWRKKPKDKGMERLRRRLCDGHPRSRDGNMRRLSPIGKKNRRECLFANERVDKKEMPN